MNSAKVQARFVDNGDETVTDIPKNLMWAKADSWVELGTLVSWWQGQEFIKKLNDRNFAGHSDWRFPNRQEAHDLYDPELSNTDMEGCEVHIDPVFTSGCGYTTWTTEIRGAKAAMGYDYRADYEYWLARENDGFRSAVRPVRSVTSESALPAEERYVDHKNGAVSDLETGLMWKRDDSYLDMDKWISWSEAKVFIAELNKEEFAGHTDWRMPTRKEAQSIHDPANPITDAYGDALYLVPAFPPGAGQSTWTKTLNKTDRGVAIRFNFFSGDYKFHEVGLRSHGVRPVRTIKREEQESS